MFQQTLSLLLGCTDFPQFVCDSSRMQFQTVRQDSQRMDLTKNIESYILELSNSFNIMVILQGQRYGPHAEIIVFAAKRLRLLGT